MKRKGNNDLAMIYIMEILASRTDPDHPMPFRTVEAVLRNEYGLDFERRTIADKVNLLIDNWLREEEGELEEIVVRKGAKKGVYYNREFQNEELDLLIYSVMANRNIPQIYKENLKKRLEKLGGSNYNPLISAGRNMIIESHDDEAGNHELFLNLEDINYAINHSNQISFDYCRYGIDKKLHIDSNHTASPYYVMMKEQDLWLIAYSETHETVSFFRIDRIKNISILRRKAVDLKTVRGYDLGLEEKYLQSSLPYMFSDRPEWITFRADEVIVDQIVDWFGSSVTIEKDREDSSKVKARLRTSPMAMEYWAKQYMDHVEIIKPLSLRKRILESLKNSVIKYTDAEK